MICQVEDTYKTILSRSESIYTEKRSKFIAIALPVRTLSEVKDYLEEYQKKYYDARHVCYAYMLGAELKVGTYNYFKDIEKDNLCPCSLLK